MTALNPRDLSVIAGFDVEDEVDLTTKGGGSFLSFSTPTRFHSSHCFPQYNHQRMCIEGNAKFCSSLLATKQHADLGRQVVVVIDLFIKSIRSFR